jgi:hypothetical protein
MAAFLAPLDRHSNQNITTRQLPELIEMAPDESKAAASRRAKQNQHRLTDDELECFKTRPPGWDEDQVSGHEVPDRPRNSLCSHCSARSTEA